MIMKKVLLTVVIVLCATFGFAQTETTNYQVKKDSTLIRIDSLIQVTNAWLEQIELDMSLKQRYKLYQTENLYTFLQLDTKTGMIEQVQWSLDSDNEGSVTINSDDLTYGYGYGSGSFELYPTKNMYQFLLIDKTSGKKWHVQWGMESSKRWIRRIY
jgi:hypothetical protein